MTVAGNSDFSIRFNPPMENRLPMLVIGIHAAKFGRNSAHVEHDPALRHAGR